MNSFSIVKEQRKKCNISEDFNLFREKCFALCLNWKTLEKVCAHCKCQVERGIQWYREKWGPKKRQNMPRKTEPLLFPNRLFLDEGPSFWFFENRKKNSKIYKIHLCHSQVSVWTHSKYSVKYPARLLFSESLVFGFPSSLCICSVWSLSLLSTLLFPIPAYPSLASFLPFKLLALKVHCEFHVLS